MKWEEEALKIIEKIPLPPIMAHLAKMDAERRARQKGLDTVEYSDFQQLLLFWQYLEHWFGYTIFSSPYLKGGNK